MIRYELTVTFVVDAPTAEAAQERIDRVEAAVNSVSLDDAEWFVSEQYTAEVGGVWTSRKYKRPPALRRPSTRTRRPL